MGNGRKSRFVLPKVKSEVNLQSTDDDDDDALKNNDLGIVLGSASDRRSDEGRRREKPTPTPPPLKSPSWGQTTTTTTATLSDCDRQTGRNHDQSREEERGDEFGCHSRFGAVLILDGLFRFEGLTPLSPLAVLTCNYVGPDLIDLWRL